MKWFAIPLLALILAGCGGSKQSAATTAATTTGADTIVLRVYFTRDDKVGPAARSGPHTQAVAAAALEQLLQGPTTDETGIGLATSIPSGTTLEGVTIADGVATVRLSPALSSRLALAQVVYTLTQFPSITGVRFAPGGATTARADYEADTPRILVETPLPFAIVTGPVRVAGTADTFEANFTAELAAADGTVLDRHAVTATSGSGTRGTYETTLAVPAGQTGAATVKVWEPSAENGQPLGIVAIPVTLG